MTQLEPDPTAEASGAVVAEISREVVQIHARYYGRGPTKAKAVWRHEIVVVVLEEVFTRAEMVLIEGGRFEQVRAYWQAFQDEIEPLLCQVVERATGRPVRSLLSQVSGEGRGIACAVFILGEGSAAEA